MTWPVTVSGMNYASVMLVGFTGLFALWYYIGARHTYVGPPEAQIDSDIEETVG